MSAIARLPIYRFKIRQLGPHEFHLDMIVAGFSGAIEILPRPRYLGGALESINELLEIAFGVSGKVEVKEKHLTVNRDGNAWDYTVPNGGWPR